MSWAPPSVEAARRAPGRSQTGYAPMASLTAEAVVDGANTMRISTGWSVGTSAPTCMHESSLASESRDACITAAACCDRFDLIAAAAHV